MKAIDFKKKYENLRTDIIDELVSVMGSKKAIEVTFKRPIIIQTTDESAENETITGLSVYIGGITVITSCYGDDVERDISEITTPYIIDMLDAVDENLIKIIS